MRRLPIALAGLLLIGAAPPPPADVSPTTPPTPDALSDFLAYCGDASHQAECIERVQNVDISNEADALYGKKVCMMPDTDSSPAYDGDAKQVLGWLSQHPDLNAPTTNEAVTQAVAALWPACPQ